MTALHAGAITIAVLSGICALAALAAGSPLEFGVALALFGVGWIAADFIEWTIERDRERAARRGALPAARSYPDHNPCHVVFIGRGAHFSRPAPRAVSRSAA
ncbi:MAG: hypothetical protein WCE76_07025 [Mycobacterium sp.]